MKFKKVVLYISAILIAAFGLLTLFLSGSVIFDLFEIRAQEGNYVLFVVWANFISSLLYLFSAYGFLKMKNWTVLILGISAVLLTIAFTGLIIRANTGGIYETKTIGAMIFRVNVTLVFTFLAYFFIFKKQENVH